MDKAESNLTLFKRELEVLNNNRLIRLKEKLDKGPETQKVLQSKIDNLTGEINALENATEKDDLMAKKKSYEDTLEKFNQYLEKTNLHVIAMDNGHNFEERSKLTYEYTKYITTMFNDKGYTSVLKTIRDEQKDFSRQVDAKLNQMQCGKEFQPNLGKIGS